MYDVFDQDTIWNGTNINGLNVPKIPSSMYLLKDKYTSRTGYFGLILH